MNELLQKLKELGVEEENGTSIVELVTGMLEAETEKGKGFYRKKDGEAKALRESLKKLGFDSDKFENVDEYLSAREKENSQTTTTMESLKEALESMKAEVQAERDLRVQGERETLTSKAMAELTSGLNNVYGSKHVIKGILADKEVKLGDNGNIMIGDTGVSDFVSNFLEENPDIVKAQQQGGSGDRQQDGGGAKDFETMSTLDALSSVG
jgi:hypothetical protein